MDKNPEEKKVRRVPLKWATIKYYSGECAHGINGCTCFVIMTYFTVYNVYYALLFKRTAFKESILNCTCATCDDSSDISLQ